MKKETTSKKKTTRANANHAGQVKLYQYCITYQNKNRKIATILTNCRYKIEASRENVQLAIRDVMHITNGNFESIIWFKRLDKVIYRDPTEEEKK